MSEQTMNSFETREALDEQLADDIAAKLVEGIDARGSASMAVSGGSTPRGVFTALASKPIEWSKVRITLVDDRWVDPTHKDSNELLVNRYLRIGEAASAPFVSLHTEHAHPSQGQAVIEARLGAFETIDVMMLGMGGDGHFASLFPDSDVLAEGLDLSGTEACIAVDPPVAPHARMSMTLPRIFDSRFLVLHICGDDKVEVLEQARQGGDAMVLPIASLLAPTAPDLAIYWAP